MRSSSTSARFTLAGIADAEASVIDEERTVPIAGGIFTDSFDAYAVHLYRVALPDREDNVPPMPPQNLRVTE